MSRSPRRLLAATILVCLVSPLASAHTVWLEQDGSQNDYTVRFGGHAGVLEEFPPQKLKQIAAKDADGLEVSVAREDMQAGVRLSAAQTPSLITLFYDNGYWSTLSNGRSENLPMDQVADAVSAVSAVKYHKYIQRWDAQATKPQGQAFELLPLDAKAPAAGQPVSFQVLIDGKPAEGIELAFGEAGKDAVSDANGHATLTTRSGVNRIWAGQRLEVADNPHYTQLSTEYSLVFYAGD